MNAAIGHNQGPELDNTMLLDIGLKRHLFGATRNGIPVDYTTEAVIAECGELDTMPAAQIAEVFAHIKDLKDSLEAELKTLSGFVELIKNVKLPEAFDRDKITSFTLQNGTRVTKSERTTCSILDPEAAFQWLRDNNMPDVIKETVNAQTMGSIARDILANVVVDPETGMPKAKDPDMPIDLPAEIFKVNIQPTTSVTKGKKK